MDTNFAQLLADHLPEEQQTPQSSARFLELGMDSMATLGLYLAVERHYGIRLNPQDIATGRLASIDGLWEAVQEGTAAASVAS